MTDKAALEAALAKVKAATGPDRGLDGNIGEACGQCQVRDGFRYRWSEEGSTNLAWHAPSYTSSVDAALALVERKLPGTWWLLSRGQYRPKEPPYGVHLLREGYDPDSDEEPIAMGEAATLPLAIIAALLTALIQVEP